MANKEARDAVKDERPFAGVHILATAMLCAKGSSDDELELARRLLERDTIPTSPRESESVAGAFNRHMDAAIDSVNNSMGVMTRAERRAMLAQDLDRAELVLMDRAMVAALIQKIHERDAELAELAPFRRVARDGIETMIAKINEPGLCDRCAGYVALGPCTCGKEDGEDLGAELLASSAGVVGLDFQEGVSFLTHSPTFDVAATGSSVGASGTSSDPRLND